MSRRGLRGGRLLLETPFGAYAVESTPGGLLSIAYKLVETCRETLQAMHRRVVEEVARAEGLERQSYEPPATR